MFWKYVMASLVLIQNLNICLNIEYAYSDATTKLYLTKKIISESEQHRQLELKLMEKDEELKEKDEEL